MNLCIVSLQAVLLVVILIQYNYVNEVEAEKQAEFSVGNWFSSIEQKINVQGAMTDVIGTLKKTADDISQIPRRLFHGPTTTTTTSTTIVDDNKKGEVDIYDMVNSQEMADLKSVMAFDASDVTNENNDTEYETTPPEAVELTTKKRRGRKHKKKNKIARERTDASFEKKKPQFGRKAKKDHKKKLNKRKFVKMSMKEANSSDSEESKRGKPVDIIVHIKMNE